MGEVIEHYKLSGTVTALIEYIEDVYGTRPIVARLGDCWQVKIEEEEIGFIGEVEEV